MDCSPPGSSVCEISQARILVWVAISSSGRSSRHNRCSVNAFKINYCWDQLHSEGGIHEWSKGWTLLNFPVFEEDLARLGLCLILCHTPLWPLGDNDPDVLSFPRLIRSIPTTQGTWYGLPGCAVHKATPPKTLPVLPVRMPREPQTGVTHGILNFLWLC